MKSRLRTLIPGVSAILIAFTSLGHAGDGTFQTPDSIVLKDGRTVYGLILKNTRDAVLLQEAYDEVSYPKSEIVRIRDEDDMKAIYTDIDRHGELPPWRVIVNDLRVNDMVKTFIEIPATRIDNGIYKNIPYKSFRINGDIELNIYGDPEDPAAVEVGIYGLKQFAQKGRKTLRAFLAGFLSTKEEVSALYSIGLSGGEKATKDLTFKVTPRSAPDAYGAWWISMFNPKTLNEVRLTDAEYDKITMPVEDVVNRRGKVRRQYLWTKEETLDAAKAKGLDDDDEVILRGFFRDKDGVFRLIGSPNS